MKILYVVDDAADPSQVAQLTALMAQRGEVNVVIDAEDDGFGERLRSACDGTPNVRFTAVLPIGPTPLSYLAGELLRSVEQQPGASVAPWMPSAGWLVRVIPTRPAADALLDQERPDVLVTPPLMSAAVTADLVHSARARGVNYVVHRADTAAAAQLHSALTTHHASTPAVRRGFAARVALPVLVRLATRVAARPALRLAHERRVARLRRARELAAEGRRSELAAARERLAGERLRRRQARTADRDAKLEQRATQRALAQERLARAASRAAERFVEIREWARCMRSRATAVADTTDAERQVIRELAPLWDAGPEVTATLRRWGGVISGVRPEPYDDMAGASLDHPLLRRLRAQFYAMQKDLASRIMVTEPGVLGAFGAMRNGILFTEDSLQYWHAMTALDDGALLDAFTAPPSRPVVWEVGGGWGGFAYQFKTLCPHVTYLITGPPELLLVSATYLSAVFPEAVCRFFEGAGGAPVWDAGADFVFAIDGTVEALHPPRLELTLDITTLQRSTPARAAATARTAFDWASRYCYSQLATEGCGHDGHPVWRELTRYFWPHEIPVREIGTVGRLRGDEQPPFAHFTGWKRIRV